MDSIWSSYSKNSNIIVACVPLKTAPSVEKSSEGLGGSSAKADKRDQDDSKSPVSPEDLFEYGVAARIINLVRNKPSETKQYNASYIVTLEGVGRLRIDDILKTSPFLEAQVTFTEEKEPEKDDKEFAALAINLRSTGRELASVLAQLQLPPSVLKQLNQIMDSTPPGRLADLFASMIDLSLEEKLQILELSNVKERITRVLELLTRQVQVLKISQKLQTTVENKLGQKQREFILRQQLNAIKAELGESDDAEEDEVGDLAKRLSELKLPDEVSKAAQRELRRLKKMQPSLAEYQVIRAYLELICELPWGIVTEDILDISRARAQLDEDHYGLEKVKTRILEFLAVRKLKADLKGPILCFAGPPGVGKTSLGKSIATALGRKFYRISLGGVRDEAEIRGHRRTYVGAMPGVFVQGLRRSGVNNPVILLDEIDKLGRDFRGDPASALLEVLDPEQNATFVDHYLNVPFDLSNVLFIATANDLETIPAPLLDRMEIIRIPGYTFEEKLHIARKYLLPKQIKAHGLEEKHVVVKDEVLNKIAISYTREAGVRNLEREIAAVCRAVAVEFTDAKEKGAEEEFDGFVTHERLEKILGPDKFDDEVAERTSTPGVVTGLAWTSSGAGGLLFIEATQMPGKGNLVLTGKLGDVMKESAQIGLTWVRANAAKIGIAQSDEDSIMENNDVHIHFPAGAIPKDGPRTLIYSYSAGVSIVTALVSLFSGKPVRQHLAMTGEITLRGQVLPVGGIKEKVLAAHRGGIKRVIMPHRNQKDLNEVPANVLSEIEFCFAKTAIDVLRLAFDDGFDRLPFAKPPFSSANKRSSRTGNLHISDFETSIDEVFLRSNNITHVVCLGWSPDEALEHQQQHCWASADPKREKVLVKSLAVDLKDDFSDPTALILKIPEIVCFVSAAVNEEAPGVHPQVLFHCVAGVSRSAAACAAYLMASRKWTAEHALNVVRASRPEAAPNPSFLRQLKAFEDLGCQIEQDSKFARKLLELEKSKALGFHALQIRSDNRRMNEESVGTANAGEAPVKPAFKVLRCKKCRHTVAEAGKILIHEPLGAESFSPSGKRRVQKSSAISVPVLPSGSSNVVSAPESGDSSEASRDSSLCTTYFLEPMEDIPAVADGSNEGRIDCPKCDAKLGMFNWAGFPCSCGEWVAPAFGIHKSKVDTL
ncbi:hypothetical protein HDU96_003422 [Phlyctochytrium bullatum]|nr:hypothetical protein HDU96_003422 [Phlyctochytrium bullatum]